MSRDERNGPTYTNPIAFFFMLNVALHDAYQY